MRTVRTAKLFESSTPLDQFTSGLRIEMKRREPPERTGKI